MTGVGSTIILTLFQTEILVTVILTQTVSYKCFFSKRNQHYFTETSSKNIFYSAKYVIKICVSDQLFLLSSHIQTYLLNFVLRVHKFDVNLRFPYPMIPICHDYKLSFYLTNVFFTYFSKLRNFKTLILMILTTFL